MRSKLYWRLLMVAIAALMAMPLTVTTATAGDSGPGINTPSRLIIQAIRCNNQNDFGGDDEPFITIDGLGRVWETRGVDEEQWIGLDLVFHFEGSIVVHLNEDDGGATGEDDHLGVWVIPDTLRGAFVSFFQFDGYQMWITVQDA